uniref:DUF89 family protein n=1 Tax=candidate division WOR-3 bacterium TaxID=2052148 RepID=A0A7C4YIE3_UNCW3
MKIKNICIPCALEFAYRTLKFIGKENDENIMKEILNEVKDIDYSLTPAHLGTIIFRKIKSITGIEDPYKEEKKKQNNIGKKVYNILKEIIKESENPFIDAIKISCVGNSIDLGATGIVNLNFQNIKEELNFILPEKSLKDFIRKIKSSKSILFITDNSGEIFFDKIFLEEIKDKKLYVSVKSGAIINDITIKEIEETGIQDFAEIIPTGTDSLGIIMEEVSDKFIKIFNSVDMVIAKGHANFETLLNQKKSYFILRAKCDYVSEILNVKKMDYFAGKI